MKNSINNWTILFIVIAMLSCESERDTFKELTSEGERVVIGKVQDAEISYGVNKLKFDIAINSDPKIKKFIFKDGEEEIKTFDFVRENPGLDTITYILDNLKEKLYEFNIIAADDAGNESLTYRVTSTVFGDGYIANLPSRTVDLTFDPSAGSVKAVFSEKKENMKETILTYTNRDDVKRTITIANDSTSLTISDFKPSDTLRLVSTYSPALNERESFEDFVSLEINKAVFPDCEGQAVASTSVTNMDFGQLNNGSLEQQTFTVQSNDCLTSTEIYANAVDSEQFSVSLSSSGPFESSVLLGDISSEKTVYVKFNANTGKNKSYKGKVKVEGANITSPPVIAVTGEEIGNIKSGLLVLNKDREGPFKTVGLPGDIKAVVRGTWGLFHEALFDGNWKTLGRSQENAIPGVFTIDLAAEYDIVKAGWVVRGDKCCGGNRALKRYQVWGLPNVTDIMNAVPTVKLTSSTEKEWATAMLEKGWKNMVNASLTENPNKRSDGRVTHFVPFQLPVRYIRVAIFEKYGGASFIDFGELELTADFGQ